MLRRLIVRVVLAMSFFIVTIPSSVLACDFCLMHQGISPLETLNGAGIRVTQRYTYLGAAYQGTTEFFNPGASEQFWTTDVSAFYSLTEGLLVMGNIPLRVTQGNGEVATAPGGGIDLDTDKGGDHGIGDMSLLARYTFFRHHTLDSTLFLALTAGVKLPTGSTDGRNDDGNFLDAHIQPGTGSTDGLFGFGFNYAKGKYSLSGNILASIAGEGEFGNTSHQFGDAVNYDITGRYRIYPATIGQSSTQVFLSMGLAGETRQRELENNVKVFDSGGTTLYATPGLQINFAEHWVTEFTYQHAVYHNLFGTQLGEDYKLFGSLTYLF